MVAVVLVPELPSIERAGGIDGARVGNVYRRSPYHLVAHLPELSRSQLQRLIQEGQVGLTQGVVTASYRVREGDIITLDVPPPRPARPVVVSVV